MKIHVVFAEIVGRPELHFVEVEDERGKSVLVGKWVKRDDGLVALVLDLDERAPKEVE